MTKVLVFSKDYPEAATYRGPAYHLNLTCGNLGLAPSTDALKAAAETAANQKGLNLLRLKIYIEETIPIRYLYYEIYGYAPVARAFDPATWAGIIILAILAILGLYIIWQISITGREIIWGPSDGGGFPWGAIVILAIVGVAAYFLITQRELVTKGIRVVGRPIARRMEAM